jgi:hypothetical protein
MIYFCNLDDPAIDPAIDADQAVNAQQISSDNVPKRKRFA